MDTAARSRASAPPPTPPRAPRRRLRPHSAPAQPKRGPTPFSELARNLHERGGVRAVFEAKEGAMRRVLLAVSVLLLFAPAAHAGGWATVSLSSTPTAKRWVVDLT